MVVDVSAKLNLPFWLDDGSITETTSVLAYQAQVSTADASGGTIVDPEQVQNLPRGVLASFAHTGVKAPTARWTINPKQSSDLQLSLKVLF